MGHSYKELVARQVAKELAIRTYKLTEGFPKSENYGLSAQVRRAAVSAVSNIAEGQGRVTSGEFQQFLGHARGSLLELETQFIISLELKYLSPAEFAELERLAGRAIALVNGLIESIQSSQARRTRATDGPRSRRLRRET